MLINKSGYSPNDIISLKLVNGDELVASLIEETESSFVIKRPASVVPAHGQGIALIQAMITGELNQTIKIDKSHVMMNTITASDVKAYYVELTTGIKTAGGKPSLVI